MRNGIRETEVIAFNLFAGFRGTSSRPPAGTS
jgi:hypothetical protein